MPQPRLPGTLATTWAWQELAHCRGEDPATFFSADGERGHDVEQREREAKAFCASCTVIVECREHSLRHPEPFGTWGGLSEHDRRRILVRG